MLVDLVQTAALVIATSLAVLTYFAERERHRDEEVGRRLNDVARRVAALGHEAALAKEHDGRGGHFSGAKQDVRSALAFTPIPLPASEALTEPAMTATQAADLVPGALDEIRAASAAAAEDRSILGRIRRSLSR